jgi:hypothetical protein
MWIVAYITSTMLIAPPHTIHFQNLLIITTSSNNPHFKLKNVHILIRLCQNIRSNFNNLVFWLSTLKNMARLSCPESGMIPLLFNTRLYASYTQEAEKYIDQCLPNTYEHCPWKTSIQLYIFPIQSEIQGTWTSKIYIWMDYKSIQFFSFLSAFLSLSMGN